MKTTNETRHGSGWRSRVESAWKWMGQLKARTQRLPGGRCGHHFRLDDFRAIPRMAAGMDPHKMRTRLFKLSHSVFLCPYFQYFLKIQKQK
jgi:hypothetical protein